MHWRCLLAGSLSAGLATLAAAPVWAFDATPGVVSHSIPADSASATPAPLLLQLRVVSGEGQVHSAGVRSAELLTVQITDETGRPLPRVTVSVRLPDEGPTGTFKQGLKTDVQQTGPDGRASFRDVIWRSGETGTVSLRITAAKGAVRAGGICSQYVGEAKAVATAPAAAEKTVKESSGNPPRSLLHISNRMKWTLIGLAASGIAGTAAARRTSTSAPPPTTVPQPTPLPTAGPAPQVGTPTITVGHP